MSIAVDAGGEDLARDIRFSYAGPQQRWDKRALIRSIEAVTGQPKLRRLYNAWTANPLPGENLFSAGVRLLNIDLRLDGASLAEVPREGGVLFVANHPFGVVDGLVMGHIATSIRPDTRIMTHSLLCQPREGRDYLLPVDFSGTAEGARVTMETRRRAQEWLTSGHSMVIFPGGGVATSQKPFKGPALEPAWHPFVGKLARLPNITIVPIYFHGQNSRLFQIVSHASYSLRVALLFRESMRHVGQPLRVTVGKPIASSEIARIGDRAEAMREVRRRTLALSGDHEPLMPEFQWPAHIRWN